MIFLLTVWQMDDPAVSHCSACEDVLCWRLRVLSLASNSSATWDCWRDFIFLLRPELFAFLMRRWVVTSPGRKVLSAESASRLLCSPSLEEELSDSSKYTRSFPRPSYRTTPSFPSTLTSGWQARVSSFSPELKLSSVFNVKKKKKKTT